MADTSPPSGRREILSPEEHKENLRRSIREARSRMSEKRRAALGEELALVALSIADVQRADTVALYVNRPSEPPTLGLIEFLAGRNQRVLLPKLGENLARDWAYYASSEDLQVRAPGRPPEPSGPGLGADAIGMADVVILPALAVDTTGARLGQGGGWYDRSIAAVSPGVPVFAVVYDEEIFDATEDPLPQQEHDRLVDGVITPSGWRWLRLPDGSTPLG